MRIICGVVINNNYLKFISGIILLKKGKKGVLDSIFIIIYGNNNGYCKRSHLFSVIKFGYRDTFVKLLIIRLICFYLTYCCSLKILSFNLISVDGSLFQSIRCFNLLRPPRVLIGLYKEKLDRYYLFSKMDVIFLSEIMMFHPRSSLPSSFVFADVTNEIPIPLTLSILS